MNISHKKQRQFGIILTYLQMALSILVNVICTPIILNKLGQSEYGIYNLTSSIISYLSLLTLGFGASYIKFYSKYKAENDEEGVNKLNGLYLIVFTIMGLVALVLGIILSFNSSILFNETYSASDLKIAKILMLLLTFNMAVSFPASVFSSIIASQEEFIFQRIVNIGKTVLAPAISIVVIFFGYGSIGMVAVTTIISLIIDFINVFYCTKKLKAKFKFGKIDVKLLKEIAIFSFFIAINQLIDQINTQTDKIILGKMINASAVAVYAIAATIQSMYTNFSTAVNSVFAPKIHSIVNSKDKDMDDKLTDIFIKIGRIQFFILMLVLTGYIFFGKYFVIKWAGADYELAYYLVLILMIPSTVPLIQNIGIEIQRAKNKHQFRSLVYLLIAIINIVISIILCRYYGIVGVTIGTAFANIIGCCIIMNIYYHKKLGINIIKFWKSILRAFLGLIIPIICGTLILNFVKFKSFGIYLSFIVVYTIIYLASIYLFGMNSEEKMFIKKVFKKVKKILKMIAIKFIRFFKKLGFKKKCDVLIYSHYDTMDPHVLKFYNSIKNENLNIKIVFFKVNKVDKKKYEIYGLDKNKIIMNLTSYLFLEPKVFVIADLCPIDYQAFNSKFIYVNHGSATLAWGNEKLAYSYQFAPKYYDVYFENNKYVVDNFDADENLKNKIVFSGNKFNDDYKLMESKRDEIREKFNIAKNQKVIFVCGSWNKDSLFHVIGEDGLKKIQELSQNKKYKFILSIHPKEYIVYNKDIKPLGKEIDKMECENILVRKSSEDFIPYMIASDLVISDFTSMGDNAVMLGKPICYLKFNMDNIFEFAGCKMLMNKVPNFSNLDEFVNCIVNEYPKESMQAILEEKQKMDTPQGYWDDLCKETLYKLMEKK